MSLVTLNFTCVSPEGGNHQESLNHFTFHPPYGQNVKILLKPLLKPVESREALPCLDIHLPNAQWKMNLWHGMFYNLSLTFLIEAAYV